MANSKKATASQPQPFRVGFLVHDVSRMRRTLFDQAMKPLGVTRSQWWLLANLSRHPQQGMAQTEVARVMDTGKATVGGLIDRLEGTGHVERRSDPADRRVNRVFITAKGHKVLDEMSAVGRLLNVKVLDGLTAAEVRAVEAALHKMKNNLRAALNGVVLAEFDEWAPGSSA